MIYPVLQNILPTNRMTRLQPPLTTMCHVPRLLGNWEDQAATCIQYPPTYLPINLCMGQVNGEWIRGLLVTAMAIVRARSSYAWLKVRLVYHHYSSTYMTSFGKRFPRVEIEGEEKRNRATGNDGK